MVEDLAAAWRICPKQTKEAFPVPQRKPGAPGKPWPGQWIDDTNDGKLRYLIRMPSQAQKHISKAQRKLAVGWVREELEQGGGGGRHRGAEAEGWL